MTIKCTAILLFGLVLSACSKFAVESNLPHKQGHNARQFSTIHSTPSHLKPRDEPTWYWTHRQLFSKVAEGSMSSEQLKNRLLTDIYDCQLQSKMNTSLDCNSQSDDHTCSALRDFHAKRNEHNRSAEDQSESMSRFSSCIKERGWARNT